MRRPALACLAAAALAACVPKPVAEKPVVEAPVVAPPPVQPEPPRTVSESESLLAYYHQLRGYSGAELSREHEAVRQAYGRSRSDSNRVRYAMILALPNTPFTDDARALEMLEPMVKNPGQLQALAYLMVTHLQERRRLDANAQALQQKLDALRSLERSMIERKKR